MWFPIPYERFIIKTHLNGEQALARLEGMLGSPPLFRWLQPKHKPFDGEIDGYAFQISRIDDFGRRCWWMSIEGEICPEAKGCSIRVAMHMDWLAWILSLVLVALAGYALLGELLCNLDFLWRSGALGGWLQSNAFPGILLICGCWVYIYVSKLEWDKAKAALREKFEAYQVDGLNP